MEPDSNRNPLHTCETCDSPIPSSAAGGICPRCLAKTISGNDLLEDWLDDGETENNVAEVGDRIGDYLLCEKIGEGGFGEVFLAEQIDGPGRAALKVIKPGMDSRAVIARFEIEQRALALLDHPGIAKVLDSGETKQGRPYFAMELIAGTPITTLCNEKELDLPERLAIFVQLCDAMDHAHQNGIVHRDLKPSNILTKETDDDGFIPVVIDFGMAKATEHILTEKTVFTQANQMIGTPEYMSPEQAGGGGIQIDVRSDVYSLGVLLYELLTGTTPVESHDFQNAGIEEVARLIRDDEPEKPSSRATTVAKKRSPESTTTKTIRSSQIRGDIDWIVLRALEKNPLRRYANAGELGADVKRFLAGESVLARPPSLTDQIRRKILRNRITTAVSAAAAVSLLVGAIGAKWIGPAQLEGKSETRIDSLPIPRIPQLNKVAARSYLNRSAELGRRLAILEKTPSDQRAARELRELLARPDPQPLTDPIPHGGYLHDLAFFKDGIRTATVGQAGKLRVIDSKTGQLILPAMDCGRSLDCLSISPNEKVIATGDTNGRIFFWNAESGAQINSEMPRKSAWVTDLEWGTNGKFVVSTHFDGTVRRWEFPSGKVSWRKPNPRQGARWEVSIHPRGKLAAVTEGIDIGIYDVEKGEIEVALGPLDSTPFTIGFTRDGRHFYACCLEGEMYIWKTGKWKTPTVIAAHEDRIVNIELNRSETKAVTCSHDHTAKVWSFPKGELLATLEHDDNLRAGIFLESENREWVITGCRDATFRFWSVDELTAVTDPISQPNGVAHLALSRDQQRLLIGGSYNDVQIWALHIPDLKFADSSKLIELARQKLGR